MSSREMDMPSREINVRRFCAYIVHPDQTHARCEFSFFSTICFLMGNKFSFLSVNLPVRRSPSKMKEMTDKLM